MTPILWAVVDRDGQFARKPNELPSRMYVMVATKSDIAQKDLSAWDEEVPWHAPHQMRALTWAGG